MRADLHSHTIYSDGSFTIPQIINRAKERGMDILAITDHDTFNGAKIAYEMGPKMGLKVIYGMELSTERNGESIHILCYFSKVQDDNNILVSALENQRKNRKARAYEMGKLLKEHFNIDLDMSFVEERESITRGTIGDELFKQGFVARKKEAFTKMIGGGCPAYIPSTKLSTEEGIKLIKEAGGLCVLAHPCLYKKNDIEELIKLGVEGIEAVYPNNENSETKYRDLARKYNLLVTGGSDFHMDNDYKHGNVGTSYIKDEDLRMFLRVLENEH